MSLLTCLGQSPPLSDCRYFSHVSLWLRLLTMIFRQFNLLPENLPAPMSPQATSVPLHALSLMPPFSPPETLSPLPERSQTGVITSHKREAAALEQRQSPTDGGPCQVSRLWPPSPQNVSQAETVTLEDDFWFSPLKSVAVSVFGCVREEIYPGTKRWA